MKRLVAVAGSLVVLAFVAAACSDDGSIATSKIFVKPTWTGAETISYRVSTRGVDGAGSCEFITPASLTGEQPFRQVCAKDQFGDDRTAVADAATLAPRRADRISTDSKKGTRVTHSIVYEAERAVFTTDDGKRARSTTRDLPSPDKASPDPGWYDDDTLFWLARGLPLRAGWTGGYSHVINAGQPRVLPVEVEIQKTESVDVPAGKFEAWRVRFQRGSSVYVLWVDTQAPNRVVRAQIEDVRYELTGAK